MKTELVNKPQIRRPACGVGSGAAVRLRPQSDPTDRRGFFHSIGRAALGCGLAALGAFLVARNKICLRGGACRSCGIHERCELPQKEKLR